MILPVVSPNLDHEQEDGDPEQGEEAMKGLLAASRSGGQMPKTFLVKTKSLNLPRLGAPVEARCTPFRTSSFSSADRT